MADDPTLDDALEDPNKAAAELLSPEGTGDAGAVKIGSPGEPSAGADGSAVTGILHPVGGDDLSESTRETLGEYLGTWTLQNITKIPTVTGDALPTVDKRHQHGADDDYAATPTVHAREFFTTPTDDSDHRELMRDLVSTKTAGIESNSSNQANTLLLDGISPTGVGSNDGTYLAGDQDVGSEVVELAVSQAQGINRWGPSSPTSPTFSPTGDYAQGMELGSKGTLNPYGASRKVGAQVAGVMGRYNAEAEGIAIDEVSAMAQGLLMKATGEDADPGNSTAAAFSSGGGLLGPQTLFPGQRVPVAGLTPTKVLRELGVKMETSPSDGQTPEDTRDSYGTLNNPMEKFGGLLPISMLFLAVLTALAVIIMVIVLSLLLDVFALIPGFPPVKGDYSDPSKLPLGQRFGKNDYGRDPLGAKIYRWLGLPMLSAEYDGFFKFTSAAVTGVITFYNPRVFGPSAGFYAIVNRNAMRDIEQITEAIGAGMGDGSVTGFIEALFVIIEAFTTSATFKLMTTLIALGDQINLGGGLGTFKQSAFAEYAQPPESDPSPRELSDLPALSRVMEGDPRQATSFTVLPRLYNMPRNLAIKPAERPAEAEDAIFAADDVDLTSLNYAYTDVAGKKFSNRMESFLNGRIPTDARERIEQMLGTYYVPFYFHDLRTNEIVPLHCFVENITDSFSPAYDSVGGFGRMDPVQIYKGTTRKIGMSFWVASMGPDDYDEMWFAINRLVTMIYPQWTQGDVRETPGGSKFVMPFSQVPGASPLIRIRLGELFASNTANKSVRRLFGFGNEELFKMSDAEIAVGDANIEEDEVVQAAERTAIEACVDSIEAHRQGIADDNLEGMGQFEVAATGVSTMGGDLVALGPLGVNFVTKALHPGTVLRMEGKFRGAKWDGLQFKRTVRRGKLESPCLGQVINYAAQPLIVSEGGDTPESQATNAKKKRVNYYYVVAPFGASGDEFTAALPDPPNQVAGIPSIKGFLVPMQEARVDKLMTMKWFQAVQEAPPFAPPDIVQKLSRGGAFLNYETNAVVRSMRESGGAGLAGVITSMDIDWNAGTWEIEGAAGRAPRYAKISIGFQPIHDIAPGLAYDGTMRASVYPVGDTVQSHFGENFAVPGQVPTKEKQRATTYANLKAKFADAAVPPGLVPKI